MKANPLTRLSSAPAKNPIRSGAAFRALLALAKGNDARTHVFRVLESLRGDSEREPLPVSRRRRSGASCVTDSCSPRARRDGAPTRTWNCHSKTAGQESSTDGTTSACWAAACFRISGRLAVTLSLRHSKFGSASRSAVSTRKRKGSSLNSIGRRLPSTRYSGPRVCGQRLRLGRDLRSGLWPRTSRFPAA